MFRYILRRLIQAIPTMFGITLLAFVIMTNVPGGPSAALFLNPRLKTAEQRKAIADQLGYNDPWPIQYLRWLIGDDILRPARANEVNLDPKDQPTVHLGILRGDFGYSFVAHRPVLTMIGERVPATLELAIAATILELLIGVPVGILAAVLRGSLFDNVTRVLMVMFNAIPIFWLGLILILIFSSGLHILPPGSRCPTSLSGCPPLPLRLNHLLLPALVLSTGGIAGYSRYLRASMLDTINQDYIRTAKAKGLRARSVWFVHGARNALIPLATFLGPALTGLLSGAVITESVFSWPGLGRLGLTAINTYDYPLIMAFTILGATATILGFVLSDIFYAFIDPRIRLK